VQRINKNTAIIDELITAEYVSVGYVYVSCILQKFIFFRFYLLSMYIWFYSCLVINLCIFIVMTMYSHCMFMSDYPD